MTEPLRIFGKASSINVRKVLWTCAEAGIAFTREDVGSVAAPEFLAMNPNGLVPVIAVPNGVLWESNTICRYLAASAGRDDLLPRDPLARARVEMWMDWQATELNTAWRPAFMALLRDDRTVTPAQVAASAAAWNAKMALLDAQLARSGAFVAGDTFTLADIVIGLSVNRWLMTPIDRPSLPAVAAYADRLATRPGYRTHGRNGLP
ncbi:glutathione S-transferase family protein [Roseomonas sp. CAU 1739]|uniref:glutathione S-transferase family protein n=1 Tax=Roseomonas sp. CAU 1739 TaxID=3140364 RepID=UPI00325BB64E